MTGDDGIGNQSSPSPEKPYNYVEWHSQPVGGDG